MKQEKLIEICKNYNTSRSNLQGKYLNKKEVIEVLKSSGFKYIEIVFGLLQDYDCIMRKRKSYQNVFVFSEIPLHIGLLGKIVNEAKEILDSYISRHNQKKKDSNCEVKIINETDNKRIIDEDYCIKFLKSRGYKILKNVTEYREV